jgi:hypothetical protein
MAESLVLVEEATLMGCRGRTRAALDAILVKPKSPDLRRRYGDRVQYCTYSTDVILFDGYLWLKLEGPRQVSER